MSIIEAIILGIVQGLTEFIPVSSSGHLLLGHEILGSGGNTLGFDVALHVGTLVALLIYFRHDIIALLRNAFSNNSQGKMARFIVVGTIPALVIGLLFSDFIDTNLRSPAVVAVSLAVVAVVMLVVDSKMKQKGDNLNLTNKRALGIGFAQACALIPGVSRSGATITAGLIAGLGREQAARFSFLLAMPIVAGSALGLMIQDVSYANENQVALIFGMIAAFLSGLFAISFMLRSIARLGLRPFAYYRLVLALVVFLYLV